MSRQTFRWSVRRELWENRSVYLGPLMLSAFCMFTYMISTIGMPHRRRELLLLDPAKQRAIVAQPYDAAAAMLFFLCIIIALFYCLDALYGERRDRSVLFWKSLPVSDRTTVLSKMTIPMAILPGVTFVVIVVLQLMMLIWTTIILAPFGLAFTSWERFNIAAHAMILLYSLIAMTLWYAPIYGWLLLVSAWAKRAAFLWAILPIFVLGVLDHILFQGTYFVATMKYRVIGFAQEAFSLTKNGHLASISQLTPGRFLSAPGLWVGLVLAALFVAAAVRMRRHREPI